MSYITNQKLSYQRLLETNYAGGDLGAKRSLTKIAAGSTTLGMWCFRLGSSITMPKVTILKNSFGGSLASNFKRYRKADSLAHRDGATEHYIQNNDLITAALLTDGANPNVTYVFHWEDGTTRYESFGCCISEYILNINSKENPFQQCKWKCHNTKYAITTGTDVLARSDVGLIDSSMSRRTDCSLSLASTVTIFESLQLTITNEMVEQEIESGIEHAVVSKDIKLSFTSNETDTTRYNKDLANTIGDETIVINAGSFTLTLTHMDIVAKIVTESTMQNGARKVSYECFPTITTEVTLS